MVDDVKMSAHPTPASSPASLGSMGSFDILILNRDAATCSNDAALRLCPTPPPRVVTADATKVVVRVVPTVAFRRKQPRRHCMPWAMEHPRTKSLSSWRSFPSRAMTPSWQNIRSTTLCSTTIIGRKVRMLRQEKTCGSVLLAFLKNSRLNVTTSRASLRRVCAPCPRFSHVP